MGFNREFEINESQIADFLQTATEKVKTTEDVDVLIKLNKLFKKNVPWTMRKYVIAYMLKESLKHYRFYGNSRRSNNERNDRNSNNRNRPEIKNNRAVKEQHTERVREFTAVAESVAASAAADERPHHPRVEIAPEDATSIFVSIGKNRRVYPRDLVGILIAIAGIDRERIGDIKVLANYSFVQLYTEDAQNAIDKLNGYDYRGRKLAVSYSRQKTDEEDNAQESGAKPADTKAAGAAGAGTNNITEAEMAAEDAAAYAAAEKAAADKEPFGV